MDPGDASRRRRRHPLPPLFSSAAVADAAVGRHRCRLWPPSPLVTAAASGRSRRHCRPLPTPAAPAAAGHCCQPLTLPAVVGNYRLSRHRRRTLPLPLAMVKSALPRPPRLVAEALGTGAIPANLAAILAAHSQTVYEDGTACTPEERSGRGIHYFLAHLALGEVPFLGLEWVTLVGIDPDGRVHLMHSLFSVRVNVYSTECRLFACLGELPAEGLPPVVEIPPDFFAARQSVRAVPRVDQITHLGGISLIDWQTKPCERAAKSSETDYVNLACRGLAFVPFTARLGFFGGRLTDPSTSSRRRRVCSLC